jgi:hypothetical protein
MSFDISVQGTIRHIECNSVPLPPKQKYDFNPDWEHKEETPNIKTEQSVGAMETVGQTTKLRRWKTI